MNTNYVEICGTIQKDPVVRYASSGLCWASWSMVVESEGKKNYKSFIQCKAFGELAQEMEKHGRKDLYIEVSGHIQTGSYEGRNGKVYTTDVIAENIDFSKSALPDATDTQAAIPTGFAAIDDDLPF